MACSEGDELLGDDFDAVLDIIEADMLQNDEELQLEMDCLASRVTSEKDSNYKCQFCTKVCISKEGLLRHIRAKHKDTATDFSDAKQETGTSFQCKLKITELKDMYLKSAEKLANDECYPVGVTQQFQSFEILVEDINLDYEFFLPVVNSFAGDTEKFYPKCYKVCSEAKGLKNLDHDCSMILRFEVVNQVLAHLTGATIRDVFYPLMMPAQNVSQRRK